MAHRNPHPKLLLVEGAADKRVIPEFIEQSGHPWTDQDGRHVVDIKALDGVSNFSDSRLRAECKAPGRRAVGLIVDADEDLQERWESVRNTFRRVFGEDQIPETLPREGLVLSDVSLPQSSIRLDVGVWLMPDNQQRGMLETFLAFLVPSQDDDLWTYAREAARSASLLGAPYKEAHRDKANIYTWLAWQQEPGRQLHQALKEEILAPTQHPVPRTFVTWFERLFGLP